MGWLKKLHKAAKKTYKAVHHYTGYDIAAHWATKAEKAVGIGVVKNKIATAVKGTPLETTGQAIKRANFNDPMTSGLRVGHEVGKWVAAYYTGGLTMVATAQMDKRIYGDKVRPTTYGDFKFVEKLGKAGASAKSSYDKGDVSFDGAADAIKASGLDDVAKRKAADEIEKRTGIKVDPAMMTLDNIKKLQTLDSSQIKATLNSAGQKAYAQGQLEVAKAVDGAKGKIGDLKTLTPAQVNSFIGKMGPKLNANSVLPKGAMKGLGSLTAFANKTGIRAGAARSDLARSLGGGGGVDAPLTSFLGPGLGVGSSASGDSSSGGDTINVQARGIPPIAMLAGAAVALFLVLRR